MKNSTTPIIKHIPDFLDYLEIEKGLSNKTQENYARFLKRFTDWLVDKEKHKLLPHQLTPEDIWDYRVFLSRKTDNQHNNEPLKKNTQNYYLIAIRALLNYFTDKDIITLPSEKIKLAKQPKIRKIHFLNLQQIKTLLDCIPIDTESNLRDKAILETLFSTGLRVSELVSLNVEQFKIKTNEKYKEITVVGKGSKPRIIYFSERCLYWLKKYLDKRKDIDPALFINYKQGAENFETRRLTVRSIENIVKKYSKISGLSNLTSPHTLRHSYATDLMENGVDIRMVQEFLGHNNIQTTQIYTHVTNKKLRDVYLKNHSGEKFKKD